MSSLGIYFGPQIITIVETRGKKVLSSINVPHTTVSGPELEEKVPSGIKIVAFLKDEFRRNKIEAKEAVLALSGKDLIIRTFEMPSLPAGELKSAVIFEVKKYIPFKVEDLISDFQVHFDKVGRKNLVLFMGIKKETLDTYNAILNQLSLKANAIEYAGFSILRFLKLAGGIDKGVVGLLDADLQEEDEINFNVLENGVPLFSRDITFGLGPEEAGKPEESVPGMNLEKLKTEIRISLDYYNRKFPGKNIKKLFLISNPEAFTELEAFIREMGLAAQLIDIAKYIGKPVPFSLTFVKGYSCSLFKTIKTDLKINLLAASTKAKIPVEALARPELATLVSGIKIEPKLIILGILVCISAFIFGFYSRALLYQELNRIIAMRTKVSGVNPDASFQEVSELDYKYKEKIKALDKLIKKRLYLTESLEVIPRLMPEGMWLEEFSFLKQENKNELTLRGIAYLGDSNRELEVINTFSANLKSDPAFSKYFKEIDIISIEGSKTEKADVTNFTISCRGY